MPRNLDGSDLNFAQDGLLHFDEKKHLYTTDDLGMLSPVSTVVKYFFPDFDALHWSLKKTDGDEDAAERLREKWDINRERAASIGTFLHLQIEKYLNGQTEPQLCGTFDHKGKHFACSETFDINCEWQYFLNFRRETTFTPFRTEWRVFDPDHRVAGTIDLVCRRSDGTFEIYDWKRSNKVDPNGINQWASSINGLVGIDDTSYWHYALQQNLYRHILENFYGLSVSRMNLVVLHPELSDFRIVPVTRLEKEVNTMLRLFKA